MGLKYSPVGNAEFDLIFCSYCKVQTLRDGRENHTTSPRYVEPIFDFKEKPHGRSM